MTDLIKMMIDFYNRNAFAHDYIFGYNYKGVVYFTFATNDIINSIVKLEKASENNGYSLRFKPNNKIKEMLMTINSNVLCSAEYLEDLVKNSKYNRGEIFEKLITEYFKKDWKKDNNDFTKCGDIEINEKAYQIKYEKATFINEKQIERMRKAD